MKRLLAWLLSFLMKAVAASLRVTFDDQGGVLNRPDQPPVILAFWHNHLFLSCPFQQRYRRGRIAMAIVSRSRDGQMLSDLLAHFGIQSARGSSSKHGVNAALTARRAAPNPKVDFVVTPDGPRGPRHQIQPGLLRLAQNTGRPIVAIQYHLGWKLELKSWDRFQIPLPFSTCLFHTSQPIPIPVDCSAAEMAKLSAVVSGALGRDGADLNEAALTEILR